jgi:tetratricopeptide (TPR) repeat protein
MTKARNFAATVAMAAIALPAAADLIGSPQSQALVREGLGLYGQGRGQDAVAKFQEAAKLSPNASTPVSGIAFVLFENCAGRKAEDQQTCYDQAEGLAQKALNLDARDPMAQEVLRRLSGEPEAWEYKPSAAVLKIVHEAEQLFVQHKYDEAYGRYMDAVTADPRYARGWVYAGDCYYARQKWAEAERDFRKAVEIDPRDSMGWRFLVDVLANQGKRREAGQAAFRAISAHPGQMQNWERVKAYQLAEGTPLQSLSLKPKAKAARGKDGKPTVNLDNDLKPTELDTAVWLTYGVVKANALVSDVKTTAFEREQEAWTKAFTVVSEVEANDPGKKLRDPALVTLRQLYKDGQLKPALLLLTYRESFRPDLDAWIAAEPQAVQRFVDIYHLMP